MFYGTVVVFVVVLFGKHHGNATMPIARSGWRSTAAGIKPDLSVDRLSFREKTLPY